MDQQQGKSQRNRHRGQQSSGSGSFQIPKGYVLLPRSLAQGQVAQPDWGEGTTHGTNPTKNPMEFAITAKGTIGQVAALRKLAARYGMQIEVNQLDEGIVES